MFDSRTGIEGRDQKRSGLAHIPDLWLIAGGEDDQTGVVGVPGSVLDGVAFFADGEKLLACPGVHYPSQAILVYNQDV